MDTKASSLKYHISPETGRPNLCRAKYSCPLPGNPKHFDTKEEAREYFEESKKEVTLPKTHKKVKNSPEVVKEKPEDPEDFIFEDEDEDDAPDLDDWGDDLADSYCEYCGEPTESCRCSCPECYGTMSNHDDYCSKYSSYNNYW